MKVLGIRVLMGTERKRKVSLFDVVDDGAAKMVKSNGGTNNNLINRWTLRPFSQRYFDILEKRKTLPVWHQKDEFLKTLKENQTLILVGETGSGKTTQVRLLYYNGYLIFMFIIIYYYSYFLFKLYALGYICGQNYSF